LESTTGAAEMSEKPTNPKDMISSDKVPLHLWPETATVHASLALLEGALKYGRSNWRHAGARASVYYDAARRHLNRWFEGEEFDESGASNLGHALACIGILVDSAEAGKLIDDRMYPGGYSGLMNHAEDTVKAIRVRHADKNPIHFSRLCHAVESPKSDEDELAKKAFGPSTVARCYGCRRDYRARKNERLFNFGVGSDTNYFCSYECFRPQAKLHAMRHNLEMPTIMCLEAEMLFGAMGDPEYVGA
jgi:hypothetical protein